MNGELSNLPVSLSNARLPDTYEAAQNALEQCSRVDECQNWADKAEALASYAKQANNVTMRKLADRIQARAIRRAGELLKQIDGRGRNQYSEDSGAAPTTQREAAQNAGLSRDQQHTAVRVANVPEGAFNEQVESDDPPTVTKLAEQGKKKRNIVDLEGIPPEDYALATELQGSLRRLAEYCEENEPQRIAVAYKLHEVAKLHAWVETISHWIDRFVVNLPEAQNDES